MKPPINFSSITHYPLRGSIPHLVLPALHRLLVPLEDERFLEVGVVAVQVVHADAVHDLGVDASFCTCCSSRGRRQAAGGILC